MRLAALALAACSAACGGPSVGDIVSREVSLTVRAVSSDPSVVALGEREEGVALTRAFISVSALTIWPCNEEVAPLVLDPRGYELVTSSPYNERITTAVQEFCGVQLDVAPLEEGEPSVLVEGSSGSGPFSSSTDASFSLRLQTEGDESFGRVPLLLGFDAVVLLAGLQGSEDMSDLPGFDLLEQLEASLALYVDEDEDGALDPDEEPIHTTR